MFKKKPLSHEEYLVDEALTQLPLWKTEIEEWRNYTADLKARPYGVKVQHAYGDPTGESALKLLDMPPFLQKRERWVRCLESALEHEQDAIDLCNFRLWAPGASVKFAAEGLHCDSSSISRQYSMLLARLIPHAMRAGLIA